MGSEKSRASNGSGEGTEHWGVGTVSPATLNQAGGQAAGLWVVVADIENREGSSRRRPDFQLVYRNTTTWWRRGMGEAEGNHYQRCQKLAVPHPTE